VTPDEATRIVVLLLDGFRPAEWSVGSTRVYVNALLDLDYDATQVAAMRCLQTEKYMPRIADLRLAVHKVMHPDELSAGEAWALVLREVARVGVYGVPSFEHEAITESVRAVGWRAICASETIGVERAHFMRAYDAYMTRTQENAMLSPVVRDAAAALRAETHRALESSQ
jgi:hypothetical protein